MDRAEVGWKLTISPWRRCGTRAEDDGGHRFWTARYGRSAIRIDANRPGLDRWGITLEGRSIGKGPALGVTRPADAVSRVLAELLS